MPTQWLTAVIAGGADRFAPWCTDDDVANLGGRIEEGRSTVPAALDLFFRQPATPRVPGGVMASDTSSRSRSRLGHSGRVARLVDELDEAAADELLDSAHRL